jgi:Transposase DDE domain
MDYLPIEMSLQALCGAYMPLSPAQTQRIAAVSMGLLLAGEVKMSKIACFVKGARQQDSRIRWIQRLLQAPFMSQERVYQPMLKAALATFQERYWHLVIDRTTLWRGEIDLATISLNYRKRAIPLVWTQVRFGGAPEATYVGLVQACWSLIPAEAQVVFHGDTEFSSASMIRLLRQLGWDFILEQKSSTHYWDRGASASLPLSSLPLKRRGSCQRINVDLFAAERLGAINIRAFYQSRYTQSGKRQRERCYQATSLPLSAASRRLGRRRWGTEPFYRDYKSSGWKITQSELRHPQRQEGLLIILALVYLWTVCLGRWLCKTGQRHLVDTQPHRHLSLCRLGWDWLIHQLRCDHLCPVMLRLYT